MSPSGVYVRTEEHKRKLSESHIGNRHSETTKHKISESNKGRLVTEETRCKISEANKGRKHSEEAKKKMSNAMTPERKSRRSEIMKGKKNPMYGKNFSEEHRHKLSEANHGENNPMWQGGMSYEPYCPLFNEKKKEEIRNQHMRVCVITGKSALQNGGIERLTVHHIDNNKQQGCDDVKWRLVPVTQSWNSKLKNKQAGLLLNFLLIKNPRAQINVGHG